jgi:hypothetical protein
VSPSLTVDRPWLERVEARFDILTGRNVIGEASLGVALWLTRFAVVRMGPVYYLDKYLQPGAAIFLWSVQLEVNVDLLWSRHRGAARDAG